MTFFSFALLYRGEENRIYYKALAKGVVYRANNEEIGKYIKELRKSHNLTQEELAKKINISRTGLSDIECGKMSVSYDRAIAIAKLFDESVFNIFNGGKIDVKNVDAVNKTVNEITNSAVKSTRSKYINFITLLILFFIICIFGILAYYFFNSYNSVKVYKVQGESENFKTNIGLLMVSKENIYFSLSVNENRDIKINTLTLNKISDDKEELIVKVSNSNSLYLVDFYGYDEYFNYNDIVQSKNNYKLIVEYDKGKDEIFLDLTKEYENKRILFDKKEPIVTNEEKPTRDIKIPKRILDEFEYDGDFYSIRKKYKNYNFFFAYSPESELIIMEKKYNEYRQYWRAHMRSNSIYYTKSNKDRELIEEVPELNKNSEEAKEFYEEYNKYWNE